MMDEKILNDLFGDSNTAKRVYSPIFACDQLRRIFEATRPEEPPSKEALIEDIKAFRKLKAEQVRTKGYHEQRCTMFTNYHIVRHLPHWLRGVKEALAFSEPPAEFARELKWLMQYASYSEFARKEEGVESVTFVFDVPLVGVDMNDPHYPRPEGYQQYYQVVSLWEYFPHLAPSYDYVFWNIKHVLVDEDYLDPRDVKKLWKAFGHELAEVIAKN